MLRTAQPIRCGLNAVFHERFFSSIFSPTPKKSILCSSGYFNKFACIAVSKMQFKLKIDVATLCLMLSCLPLVKSSSIQVAAGMDPGANGSFQHHLCTSGLLQSDTELILGHGDHFVDSSESCVIKDIYNLTITSLGKARVLCSTSLYGHNFVFLNITNLFFEKIEMEGCGRNVPANLPSYVNYTFGYITPQQRVVFLLSHVTNLRLLNVGFSRSFGFSILAVNLRGDAELFSVTVADTDNYRHAKCYGNETDLSCSGSGALFLYSNDTVIDGPDPDNASITIAGSIFINNVNYVPQNIITPIFLNVRRSYQAENIPLTGGSALSLYISQIRYNVNVKIVSSDILSNRGYGAAIVFLIFNNIREYYIEISNCTMESNKAYNFARGGAIVVLAINFVIDLQHLPEYPDDVYTGFVVRNTSFVRNSAPTAGAIYFLFSPQNGSDYGITFDNVTFRENAAIVSSAFEVRTKQSTFVQKDIHLLMINIIATGNTFLKSVFSSSTNVENSAAFVFSRLFNITIYGSNFTHKSMFSSNSPGAFLILGGHLYLQGYMEFIENKALRGGALSMYDYSILFFHEGARVNFTRNSATQVGGAIYGNSFGTGTAPTCMFQVIGPNRVRHSSKLTQLDLELHFTNNTAVEGGNSIYASPLYHCTYLPESSLVHSSIFYNTTFGYNSIFKFKRSVSNGLQELSSIPEFVCNCSEGIVNSRLEPCNQDKLTMSLFPGQIFLIYAFAVDSNHSPVSSIVFAELDSNIHSLGYGQATYQLDGIYCTQLEFTIFGAENTDTSLSLNTRRGGNILKIDLLLKQCPPGFHHVDEGNPTCECDCYVTNTLRSSCNFTDYTISRRPNLWLGVIEHPNISDVAYVETCPSGFCIEDLSYVNLSMQDQLCIEGRTGILCGECTRNLSVVFGAPYCMECSDFWLFTIPLYALAGIVLLVVLFSLQLTVDHGTIYVIIFYANILSVDSNIIFPTSDRGFLFIWVSILNLDLGFPLCFYDGMNEAAKAGLQSIFPLYLLLICTFIIFLSEKSHRVAKLTSSNGLQVLATVVYLSYSKMLRYVIDILTFSTLRTEEGTYSVWFYDGSLKYFKGTHCIIAIFPALLTLIFVVVYSVAMIFVKQIEQKSNKFKPFMDAHAGPYKDKYRFWFGLRLFVLASICMTYALLGTDNPILTLAIQLVFLFLFILLQAYVRPYRNEWINITELIFMSNSFLLILYTIHAYQNSTKHVGFKGPTTPNEVTLLVSIAFVFFIIIIMGHFFKALYRIPIIRIKTKPLITKLTKTSIPVILEIMRASMPFRKTAAPVTNRGKLTSNSMSSENNIYTNVSSTVSSTVLSLDTALDSDITERNKTFSHLRESLIDS